MDLGKYPGLFSDGDLLRDKFSDSKNVCKIVKSKFSFQSRKNTEAMDLKLFNDGLLSIDIFLFGIFTLSFPLNSCFDSKQTDFNSFNELDGSPRHEQLDGPLPSRRGIRLIRTIAKNFETEYIQKMLEFEPETRVISPLSVFIPLLVLSYGARGDTRLELIRALGVPNLSTSLAKNGFHRLLHILNNYDLRIGTRIFYSSHLKPNLEFVDTASHFFHTTMESVDFDGEHMPIAKINQWLAEKTNGQQIGNFFEQYQVGPDPGIVLVNAIYFKGFWKSGFNPSFTKLRPFRVFNNDTIDIMTMYKYGRFQYGEIPELDSRVLKIPYKSEAPEDSVNMFVILPNKVDGYLKLVPKLRNITLKSLYRSGSMKNVHLYLPKFKVETDISLSYWLPEFLGGSSLFVTPVNFTRMFRGKETRLGPSRSKAVIEIDETGDVSDQMTGLNYKNRSPRSSDVLQTIEFRVNHSFIAVIATKGEILLDLFTINFTASKLYYKSLLEKGQLNR